MRIEIIVDDDLAVADVDLPSLRRAAAAAAKYRGYDDGEIGIRVTGDAAIGRINRQHLGHDYPTDVISFSYRNDPPSLEGELVVSLDTATRRAAELGWSAANELVLYVVHGTLHITGMDDRRADERAEMRQAEQEIMIGLGVDDIVHFSVAGPSTIEGNP